MTQKTSDTPVKNKREITVTPFKDEKGKLKGIGGSKSDAFNNRMMAQVTDSIWLPKDTPGSAVQFVYNATAHALSGIAPRDELEGMMAVQLIAAHNAAMECYRRAMIPEQSSEFRSANLSQANKLSRTYVTLLEGLNRHRGKGQQKVTVEHVHVHAGGQAVVGLVETGAKANPGGQLNSEDQCHAKQIAHEPQPEMQRADPLGNAVPIPRDG